MFKKKFIAVLVASVITVCALCVSVFASIGYTSWSEGGYTYRNYTFTVGAAQESTGTFTISKEGYYQFAFGGTTGAGANVEVVRASTGTVVDKIAIPTQTVGMPTLYRSIKLTEGTYYLNIASNSKEVNSVGAITVRI